jgi:hypothetical protein
MRPIDPIAHFILENWSTSSDSVTLARDWDGNPLRRRGCSLSIQSRETAVHTSLKRPF